MKDLETDQYTRVSRDCPMTIDLQPADSVVEIVLGKHRNSGDSLRLVIDHPDTVRRLTETLHDARTRLADHLRVKTSNDLAMSQLNTTFTDPTST